MGCLRLHHDVAQGCTLLRTCQDNGSGAVGRKLVQVFVERATADDVKRLQPERGKLLQPLEYLTVAQGQRVEDAPAYLGWRLGYRLSGVAAVLLYGTNHRRRGCKQLVVGVDDAAERLYLHGRTLQFGVGETAHLFGPFQPAALVEPHATYILQEAGGALYAALVGEIALVAQVADDGVARLDAHQAPRAARQVGELLVSGWYGSHGRARVVTGHGYDGYGAQPCQLLHLVRQVSDDGTRFHHPAEHRARQSYRCQQTVVEFLGPRVKELCRRGDGIFADLLACQHPAQGIGYEEYLACMLQGRVLLTLHGIELEDAVEVQELDASHLVHLFLGEYVLQIVVHGLEGDGVAIGPGVSQYGAVVTYADEVHAPGVNADGGDFHSTLGHVLQSPYDLEVEGMDVPVVMTALHDEVVGEASHFLQFYATIIYVSDNSSSACSPEVYCKEIFLLLFHLLFRFV